MTAIYLLRIFLVTHIDSCSGVIEWVTQKSFLMTVHTICVNEGCLLHQQQFQGCKKQYSCQVAKKFACSKQYYKMCQENYHYPFDIEKRSHTTIGESLLKKCNQYHLSTTNIAPISRKKFSQSETKHNLETETRSFATRI